MKYYLDMWKNCFNYKGKATRKEFWMTVLWNFLIGTLLIPIVMGLIARVTKSNYVLDTVMTVVWLYMAVVTLVPGLSLAVRRLRDAGYSWKFLLLALIPGVGFFMLFLWLGIAPSETAAPALPIRATPPVMRTAPASLGTGSTTNAGDLQALVAKCACYTSLTLDRSEEQAMERVLLSKGEPAFSTILSYLLFCATGAAPQGWWNNASSLVRLLLKFPEVDQARKTQALQTLAERSSNIWEYHTQVKSAAEQELLKLKKADPAYRADGLISAEDAKAELDALFNIYDNNERIKKALEMKPSAEHWPDSSKAYYYYILGDALRRRNAADQRQYAFYAAQLFCNPVNTSLGWLEFKKLEEFVALSPSPENAKMLHERYPLPASFEGLTQPASSAPPTAAPAPAPTSPADAGPKFPPFAGTGVCDVCNAPLAGKKAYLVPNPVFYRSEKYRQYRRTGVMAAMTGMVMSDAYFEMLLQQDHSPGSAVCEDCIHIFE